MLYVDAKASAYEHQFMFISTSGIEVSTLDFNWLLLYLPNKYIVET